MLISRSIGRSLRMRQYRLAYLDDCGNVTLYSSSSSGMRPRSVRAVKTTYSPSNFCNNASISVVGRVSIWLTSIVVVFDFVALKNIDLTWLNICLSAHKKTPDFGGLPKSGAKLLQKKSIVVENRWTNRWIFDDFFNDNYSNSLLRLVFDMYAYRWMFQIYSIMLDNWFEC